VETNDTLARESSFRAENGEATPLECGDLSPLSIRTDIAYRRESGDKSPHSKGTGLHNRGLHPNPISLLKCQTNHENPKDVKARKRRQPPTGEHASFPLLFGLSSFRVFVIT
jgi:hypothetical protein